MRAIDDSTDTPSKRTRRRFIGGAGALVIAAAVGAEELVRRGGDPEPAGAFRRPHGMYGKRNVNVCYAPMAIVASEPEARRQGRTGVFLRKGPSFDAEITLDNHGGEVAIALGGHLGRQSQRESAAPGCPAPPPRRAVNGFVWGYDQKIRKSGWAPVKAGGVTYAVDDAKYGLDGAKPSYICGPAGKDFDCRVPKASQASVGYKCGGPGLGHPDCSKPRDRVVDDFGSRLANNKEDFYLRLAYDSTAFQWMAPGDRVRELCTKIGSSYGKFGATWSFVEVQQGRYTPRGTRGWMLESGLSDPG